MGAQYEMDLEEIGINAGNWVDSAQDRDYWRAIVTAALNLRSQLVGQLVRELLGSMAELNARVTHV